MEEELKELGECRECGRKVRKGSDVCEEHRFQPVRRGSPQRRIGRGISMGFALSSEELKER